MARPRGNKEPKTPMLFYCTAEEAKEIRTAAKRERRTISGFIMNAVSNRLDAYRRLEERQRK